VSGGGFVLGWWSALDQSGRGWGRTVWPAPRRRGGGGPAAGLPPTRQAGRVRRIARCSR